MTREDQLKICKTCNNQKFSYNEGVICNLTNKIADFTDVCESFDEDTNLNSRLSRVELEGCVSQGVRFANLILDLIFITIFKFAIAIVVFIIFPLTRTKYLEYPMFSNYLIGIIIYFIYYLTFEAITGRTLAKYITKTKVVTTNGENPDFQTILSRSLCRLIPFDQLSFLDSVNSGWHDKLSKTKVIYNK